MTKKPKKVKAPEGCNEYFTEGKEYDVLRTSGGGFIVLNDYNYESYCLFTGCGHLNDGDWIVTEYHNPTDDIKNSLSHFEKLGYKNMVILTEKITNDTTRQTNKNT